MRVNQMKLNDPSMYQVEFSSFVCILFHGRTLGSSNSGGWKPITLIYVLRELSLSYAEYQMIKLSLVPRHKVFKDCHYHVLGG